MYSAGLTDIPITSGSQETILFMHKSITSPTSACKRYDLNGCFMTRIAVQYTKSMIK